MSKKYRTPFEDIDWSEMQKKYLDAFKIFKSSESVMNPSWINEMDELWKCANNVNSHRSLSTFDAMLQQSRIYHFMSEQFSILLDEIKNSKNSKEQVQDIINKNFKKFSYLEIGSWEGNSAMFVLKNFNTKSVTCVDSWDLNDDTHKDKQLENFKNFQSNLVEFKDRFLFYKNTSDEFFLNSTSCLNF